MVYTLKNNQKPKKTPKGVLLLNYFPESSAG